VLSPARIAIISASIGGGHDGAAAELARRLAAAGFRVDRRDFLDLLPAGAGQLIAGTYHRMLTLAPPAYQRLYAATEDDERPGPAVRALLATARRRTLAAIAPGTCAVISTYPGASQVLGALRRSGRLTVPVITYLTDFSVHALWVAAGVDAHLAVHPAPAAEARSRGAATAVCGPLVDPRFGPPGPGVRGAARVRFGLPATGLLALLIAGSWGVGEVRQAAADVHATGTAIPVVVCGRNTALAERLRRDGVPYVFEWVTDMPGLMHACDVLVQNAGGLTSLESFAAGLPVAGYRCIPGHGRANAAALDAAGLAVWIRERGELGPVLGELLYGRRGRDQRAAGLALHRRATGPVPAVLTALAGAPHPPVARRARRGAVSAGPTPVLAAPPDGARP
jgi:UDP-N-acetylglucosamine:LPS N-acetylglucosamine transferase